MHFIISKTLKLVKSCFGTEKEGGFQINFSLESNSKSFTGPLTNTAFNVHINFSSETIYIGKTSMLIKLKDDLSLKNDMFQESAIN